MKRRGFTLLETLVALAVTALVLAALAGAVTRAVAARDHAGAEAERVGAARMPVARERDNLDADEASIEPNRA